MIRLHSKIVRGIVQVAMGLLMTACAQGAVRFTTLYVFETNGFFPSGALVRGKSGDYYGVANVGGKYYQGTIFKVAPNGFLTTLFSFDITNGSGPSGGLTLSTNGFFYGVTLTGGANGYGTIFKFRPGGKLTSLFSFAGTNGAYPSSLMQGNDGNFYGTTEYGGEAPAEPGDGPSGFGTVFKMTPAGDVTTLAVFHGTNGIFNYSFYSQHLIQDASGNLYGATPYGGPPLELSSDGWGTIFKLTPDGTLKTLFAFDVTNGAYPNGLILAKDGNLYGTTYFGGAYTNGTVFKLSTDGELTTLYSFSPLSNSDKNLDGANPISELVQGSDGSLYGSTLYGGQNTYGFGQFSGTGTIFKITTNGAFTPLYSLGVNTNYFNNPCFVQGFVEDKHGNFYGTSRFGGGFSGGSGYGSAFKLSIVRPVLVVTKPHQHANATEPAITVTGKTKTKLNTPVVEVLYQVNDGGWINATSADGWTNWTTAVTLMPGVNVFQAYAIDVMGDISRTNTLKLKFQSH